MLYLGMGSGPVTFAGAGRFYILSAPAHATHPTRLIRIAEAATVTLGSAETSNARTIYQFVHPDVMKACQLVVGMTRLEPGSVWNTMPAHVHDRRMEAYLYIDLADERAGDPPDGRADRDPAPGARRTRRGRSRRPGRSTPAPAPRPTPSSGRWPATTSTTRTSRWWRWAICDERPVPPRRQGRARHRRQHRHRPGDRDRPRPRRGRGDRRRAVVARPRRST